MNAAWHGVLSMVDVMETMRSCICFIILRSIEGIPDDRGLRTGIQCAECIEIIDYSICRIVPCIDPVNDLRQRTRIAGLLTVGLCGIAQFDNSARMSAISSSEIV